MADGGSRERRISASAFRRAADQEAAKAVRDLMGLLALPALWTERDGPDVLQIMTEAVERLVPLRFTYISAETFPGLSDAMRLRIGGCAEVATFDAWQAAVAMWPASPTTKMEVHPCDTPLGPMRVAHISLGYSAGGKIMFGSDDPAFPTTAQLVLLRAAVSLAASGLQGARVNRVRADASRAKDEFLAMLGHELRNPLAPIGAAAQLLKLGNLDQAQISSASDVILRQVAHMTSMVNDLLDVSRVTGGLVTLDIRRLPMLRVVTDAIEQVSPLMRERQQRFTTDLQLDSVDVMGDHKRLVQILTNLLANAAKFTGHGGNISLRIDVRQGDVVMVVSDDGIGIDASVLPNVFELFAQAKRSSDRSQGGLGLGLSLVKSLIGLHGGTVVASSAGIDQGTRFEVRLPCAAPESHALPAPAQARLDSASGALRILVVDDNVDGAAMLSMLLEAIGHVTTFEHNAQSALALVAHQVPDVCILDIGLPGMDGNELARRLRLRPDMRDVVLIAMTGYGQATDRQLSLAAGFDHYFVKPVDIDKLAPLLAAIVDRR